jgi:hypothetical protein
MRRFLMAPLAVALVGFLGIAGSAPASAQHGHARQHAGPDITTFAMGLNNPRGLTFGPDGNLYVAEGGLGGTHSTVGKCQQAAGAAAPYTGSTHSRRLGGRIAKISPSGVVTTVVKALPSSQTSDATGNLSAASRALPSSATSSTRCWPAPGAHTACPASRTASSRSAGTAPGG